MTQVKPSQDFPKIPGYTLTQQLYEGSKTRVYRGVQADQTPVVIKVLSQAYPSFSELTHFRNQYAITQSLSIPGIPAPIGLEPWGNGYAFIMEDFGGIALNQYIKAERAASTAPRLLPVLDVLGIALQVADILHGLTQQQVIHKDIKPANILIHPSAKRIQLIDFSIASRLPKESQEMQPPAVLEGTLAYLAPEQTGRMNRGIDYRADFYSLGITLYELLTGTLPFNSTDPLELVHDHIAKVPVPPCVRTPEITPVVSQIVLKLMAKNAEDRYQSALGLKHDLEKCLYQIKETGSIEAFELGQRDVSDRFLIPEKLYGREAEVTQLLDAFERVSHQGQAEMMLVAGFSGIGKTALVNEVHKPITRQHGYFIKGKFDQFNRNIPFSAFVQAFRHLMGQLLSESDTELAAWKRKILDALGNDGQVIINVIPEVQNILGEQPEVPSLQGLASQNRFNRLFRKFVRVFTTREHPLVIFLDDLQWADSASLSLLERLMEISGEQTGHLLVLGAYRDNEVSKSHPLTHTLDNIAKHNIEKGCSALSTLTLATLAPDEITHLVTDTLLCSADVAAPLSKLVCQKTQGNPFFITQFLQGLYEENCIGFNQAQGHWHYDLAKVQQLALTDDVVDFVVKRLQKLPAETQTVLRMAACIGNHFDLETLAGVCDRPQDDVLIALWETLKEGLIIPEGETYKFFQGENPLVEAAGDIAVKYRFLHDRVQQAAYSLIPEHLRSITHHHIGHHLKKKLAHSNNSNDIFTIVNHLNFGQQRPTQKEDREDLARLNLKAGEKALAAIAYEAATEYFETGIKQLEDNAWETQYTLALALYKNLCTAHLNNANHQALDDTLSTALKQANSPVDRAEFYIIDTVKYTIQGRNKHAVETGLLGLSELGIEIQTENLSQLVQHEFSVVANYMENRSVSSLLALPLATSDEIKAAIRLLIMVDPPAYILGNIELYSLVTLKATALSIEHGNIDSSIKAYSNYGLLLTLMKEQYQRGYAFVEMALNLSYQLNSKAQQCKAGLLLSSWVHVWAKPIAGAAQISYESFLAGVEAGETLFSDYNLFGNIFNRLFQGEPLSEIEKDIATYWRIAKKNKDESLLCALAGAQIFIHRLCHASNHEGQDDSLVELEDIIRESEKAQTWMSVGFYYLLNIHFYCLTEDQPTPDDEAGAADETGAEYIQKAEKILSAVAGFTTSSGFYYYGSLVLLRQYSTLSADAQKNAVAQIRTNQEKLNAWASSCPENFLHKYLLVEAERARCANQRGEAIDLYDRAILEAKENGYRQEEALANELAAKFYLAWGKEAIAASYLQKAYYGYARWGAKAKTDALEIRYSQLLRPILQQSAKPLNPLETIAAIVAPELTGHRTHQQGTSTRSSSTQSSATRSSTTGMNQMLDFATVLKASQALSGTIELEQLLTELTQLILQQSGGDRCSIILPDSEQQWHLRAVTTPDHTTLLSEPMAAHPKLPVKLLQYVKNTQETVVINNLQTHLPVIDTYLNKTQPKSLICLPLVSQNKLLGLLSLQNQSTSEVFTQENILILSFLCTQAAISLENARLYQQSQAYAQQIKNSQLQTVQNEKMASLGNLVAGVAHEINNPIGFLNGSVRNAQNYLQDLLEHISLYQGLYPQAVEAVQDHAEDIDLEFVSEDFPKLLTAMQKANTRIKAISTSLRTFSRADTEHKVSANLHEGIDSTLLILKYRLKANDNRPAIKVVTHYGELNDIDCFPGQLNQVFMNLLANAIDVFDEAAQNRSTEDLKANPQVITITTATTQNNGVDIRIRDNGKGMTEEIQKRIFDNLFTTKGVGKGTGLGLAIAHQIITDAHGGTITVHSALGKGTEFCIHLPTTSAS